MSGGLRNARLERRVERLECCERIPRRSDRAVEVLGILRLRFCSHSRSKILAQDDKAIPTTS